MSDAVPIRRSPLHVWWTSAGGGREVLSVATPLIVSSVSWTILTFIDRIFLSWFSEVSLAASFPANLVWWTLMCIPAGICLYISTFVAQYHGAEQPQAMGPIVNQGLWITLCSLPLVAVGLVAAPGIFALGQHPPEVIQQEIVYFRVLCVGMPCMWIGFALSSLFSGQGQTWVVMLVDAITAVLNAVLDYTLIFGKWGLPEFGIAGAGWATVLALIFKVLLLGLLVWHPRQHQRFQTHLWQWNRHLSRRLILFGFPSGLQMFLDVLGFTIFMLFVGRLGQEALAATNVAFSVSSLAFMPVMSMGHTASILVGQHLGQNRDDLAAKATWNSMALAALYMLVVSLFYIVRAEWLVSGFFHVQHSASPGTASRLAAILMRYVAAYNLFDAMNLVFSGAIKGAGDMRFVFHTSFWMSLLLVLATWMALVHYQWGIHGCWTVVTLWVCVLGLIYLWRFQQGKWRGMRVIELQP